MKSILERSFHYTPSAQTDIRRTFARIRREQERAQKQTDEEAKRKVANIKRRESK